MRNSDRRSDEPVVEWGTIIKNLARQNVFFNRIENIRVRDIFGADTGSKQILHRVYIDGGTSKINITYSHFKYTANNQRSFSQLQK